MSSESRWNREECGFCFRRVSVSPRCCVTVLSLLTTLCLGCQPIQIGQPGAMSGSSVPVTKSGELAGDEAWSGAIIVEDDVTVPRDGTLTIANGTTVRFSRGSKLLISGSLYAEGQINSAITLTSREPDPGPGDWGGIVFGESSLNSRMEYCVLEFHTEILCHSDSLRLTDSIIAEGSVAGIVCDSASPTIEDNMITKNGVGIRCEGSASPTISYNAITANFLDGIECKGSSFATISYNVINNNRKNGVSCYSAASPEIASNNIMHNGGWAVYGGGKLTTNFIQGNNERGMNTIDTSGSLSSDQYYRVENVDSPRSSRVLEAGVRRKERW
jgi:parallel beta-helix repeat protein